MLNYLKVWGGILTIGLMKVTVYKLFVFWKALAILCSSVKSTGVKSADLDPLVVRTKLQYLLSYGMGSKSAQFTIRVLTESRKLCSNSFFSRQSEIKTLGLLPSEELSCDLHLISKWTGLKASKKVTGTKNLSRTYSSVSPSIREIHRNPFGYS